MKKKKLILKFFFQEKTLPTYNFVGQIVTRSGINTAEASANNLQQQGLRIPQSVWGFKNPLTQQLAAKNKQVYVSYTN